MPRNAQTPRHFLRILLPAVTVFVLWWLIGAPGGRTLLQPYDAMRLRIFTKSIAGTDRILVRNHSITTNTITLAADDVRTVLVAVSGSHSDRPPLGMVYSCSFLTTATFFHDDVPLGNIALCSSSFLINQRGAPFTDSTGELSKSLCSPIERLADEEHAQQDTPK